MNQRDNVHSSNSVPHLAYDALLGFYALCRDSMGVGGGVLPVGNIENLEGDIARWRASQPWYPVRGRDGADVDRGFVCASGRNVVVECLSCAARGTEGGADSEVVAERETGEKLDDGSGGCRVLRDPVLAGDEVVVGSSVVGGTNSGRGPNLERNRKNRAAQKARKLRKQGRQSSGGSSADWRSRSSGAVGGSGAVEVEGSRGSGSFWGSVSAEKRSLLIESKALKHIAENERDAERARRQIAVYASNGVDADARKYEKNVQAAIERSMVSIERAHGTLRATGNVPGFVGSAETILGSGSISPNSSVSEAEVRSMQKKLLDQEALIKKFEVQCGMTSDMLPFAEKSVWTDNSVNEDLLDRNCPDGYAKDFHGRVDGKFRVIV